MSEFKFGTMYPIETIPDETYQAFIDVGENELVMGRRSGDPDNSYLWIYPVVVEAYLGFDDYGEELWENYFETESGYPISWTPVPDVLSLPSVGLVE